MSFFKLERYDDDEAMVVEHAADASKIKCRLSDLREFWLPTPKDSLPQDHLHSTAQDSIITFRYLGMSKQDNLPIAASFFRTRPDLRWHDVHNLKQQVPYHVAFGNRAGAVKCRGCKRTITDKNELRVRVAGMFTAPNSGPHPGKNSFCLNASCVDQAIRRDSKNNTVYYPAFDGRVAVPADIKEAFGSELPQLDGIQWVFLPDKDKNASTSSASADNKNAERPVEQSNKLPDSSNAPSVSSSAGNNAVPSPPTTQHENATTS